MYRDFLTNKWILGSIALLIIIAGGCYFWYQHSLVDDRKAAADAHFKFTETEIKGENI